MNQTGRYESDTTVGELMTLRVATIEASDSASLALQMMFWSGIRHLPVLKEGQLVGILSDRDLLRVYDSLASPDVPVSAVMTTHVDTIEPSASVAEACARMAAKHIDCLPVMKDNKVVGILTSSDILAERGKLMQKGRGGPGHIPRAQDVMRHKVLTIGAERPLREAIAKLVDADVRHLPVLDGGRQLVGMLSDRDVRAAVGNPRDALEQEESNDLGELTVESVMKPNPVAVAPDASLLEVVDGFLDERVGALPVVDKEDRVVGIISYVDVLGYLVGRKV